MFGIKHLLAAILSVILSAGILAAPGDERDTASMQRIFFDWGKALVTRDAEATLDDVAAILLQGGTRSASIVGHSDRSGSTSANRRSALQRAAVVHDYLISRNVPSARLRISSMGEDLPLIPTADGVREPQNRRVDIIIGQ